jgi:WhiB family redox-sensing transcriptional regulator
MSDALDDDTPGVEFIPPRPDWFNQGECLGVDPELFFPERGASSREAKACCTACPVRQQCLDYALDNSEKFGIWGGLSERQRRQIRRTRHLNLVVNGIAS